MQLSKNFEINPELTTVPEFLDQISGIDGCSSIWRTICDARGNVLHYTVTSPIGDVIYQVTDLADCLSMVMNNVKWLAECLDYGYVQEVKDADV